MDREKVIKATELLDDFFNEYRAVYYISPHEAWEIIKDALKEHENQKQHWLKQIADTQLLNAPCAWQSEDQRLYAKGVGDGLQIASDIISESR